MPLSGDLKSVLKLLEAMAETERSIGQLYRACGRVDTENGAFWSMLEQEEMVHATNISKMIDIISRKPDRFEQGRPFNFVAVETFARGIRGTCEKVEAGALGKERFLFLARDNEQALLEQRYQEVVRTTDVEYQTLMASIVRDTAQHKGEIEEKIAQARKGP